MNRYRTVGPNDDASMVEGDSGFVGVNSWDTKENLQPGQVQEAVNIDFTEQTAATRGGFVCLPELGIAPFQASQAWTARSAAASLTWVSITYGNGLFVAISETGTTNRIMTSPDGITWTSRTTPDRIWRAVTFGNGLFVAVGQSGTDDRVMTSPDAITWTLRTSAANLDWSAVTYGGSLFVAVAESGTGNRVMTSSDGITWTSRTSAADNAWSAVTYGNGTYVAVSTDGTLNRVMTSTDGITWTSRTTDSVTSFRGVTFGANTFVAVASAGTGTSLVATSTDAITWTMRTAAEANEWRAVCYGNALFVAVAQTGTNRVMTSPNGITWTAAAAAEANSWRSVANGNNTFVAVSINGTNQVMTAGATSSVFASGIYSDPNDAGSRWIMLVGRTKVSFYAFGRTSRTVNIDSAETVTVQSTVVQANNSVYIFRGTGSTPLVWDGDWGNEFELATGTIPKATLGLYSQNRLWAISSKDTIQASDVLDFTTWNNLDNSFNLSKGDSDYLVTAYPFGSTSMVVFKNNSIHLLTGLDGALNDIVASELTRTVGCIGINAVTSVGPDLVYVSDRNVNLLSLTTTNNSLQHKTLPLSRNIRSLFKRVNWEQGHKISCHFWDNKLFLALPLDNATTCDTVCVYNFVTEQWYGEWEFSGDIGMSIQGWVIADYLGEQRLHCITEDGRIFVTDEGPQDISGTVVAEISTSIVTRAYRMDDSNRIPRRMWADMGTWRPKFSVTAYADGASESSAILTDQTFSRSESWIYNDSTYSLTNSGDNYNRAGRKDYAGLCSDSIQAQSGFQPEMLQEYRLPLLTRRKGRLSWFKITNTQGKLVLYGVGSEARAGDRGNYLQVI